MFGVLWENWPYFLEEVHMWIRDEVIYFLILLKDLVLDKNALFSFHFYPTSVSNIFSFVFGFMTPLFSAWLVCINNVLDWNKLLFYASNENLHDKQFNYRVYTSEIHPLSSID